MMIRIALIVLALFLVPLTSAAASEDEERARELFQNGVILYEEAQYEDAIIAWREAYRLSEQPVLLFNISDAWERLGDLNEALSYLNRYRALAPAEERETLDRRIRNLERRVAAEEERAREEAARRAEAEEAERARAEALAQAERERALQQQISGSVGDAPDERSGTGRLVAQIVFASVALGAAGTGTAFALRARSRGDDLRDLCSAGVCGPGASDLRDQERQAALIADLSFGTAILAAGGFLVSTLAFRDSGAPSTDADVQGRRSPRPELHPVAGPALTGMELRLPFR